MPAGIHPEVLRLSRVHSVSISAAHAMWLADADRVTDTEPREWPETEDEYLASIGWELSQIDNTERWARRRAPCNGEPR